VEQHRYFLQYHQLVVVALELLEDQVVVVLLDQVEQQVIHLLQIRLKVIMVELVEHKDLLDLLDIMKMVVEVVEQQLLVQINLVVMQVTVEQELLIQ
tara:strand:+ start:107 stop:397 length:291 start_codon:yes stop_codon:yes gene_type:complete